MLQSISSVFVVYRRKTLTGSPDPMHANGMDKPCILVVGGVMGGVPFSSKYHCSASTSLSIVLTVSCFLFLAHFIHINGDQPNISDLKV